MAHPAARGYSATQITLHWAIVLLVFFQLIFGESMTTVIDAKPGEAVDGADASLATAHIWVGFAILALALFRLFIRLRDGAPPAVDGPAAIVLAAKITHILFYVLLIAVPISGIVAYWVTPEAGDVHELGKPIFIILIVLHAGAALWHQFFLRDGLLMRMLKPGA